MSIDSRLAKLQRDQYGLVTPAQARAEDISYAALRRRRARGALTTARRRVLACPAVAESYEQHVLAAVLAAGETAFASHDTALALWKLPLPQPAALEVTTVLERRPRVPGVRMHRSGLLEDRYVTTLSAIPIATPELAIVSVSSRYDVPVLGRLVDEALRGRVTSLYRLHSTVEALGRAPGRSPSTMREVLARRVPGVEDRESILEDFVFDALRRFAIPLPVAQHPLVVEGRRRRIDLCYPEHALALEAKGFEFRRDRTGFDEDALRDNELTLAGFRILEFTAAFTDWRIASHVARALGMPAPRPAGRQLTFEEWKALR